MDVSIIIINYHSAGMVIDCINSVREKTKQNSYEIIVVDNASGDGSVELLRRTFPEITVIASEENLGFGKANNLGAAQAKGEYLFLLNPDTILVNDAIGILHDYLEANPGTGVAGGNLYTPEMAPAPSFCRRFDDLALEKRRTSWSALIGGKIRDKLHLRAAGKPMDEFNHTAQPQKVAYIFGADMMLKKQVFDTVGGFDPAFFMYGEEEELTWRITCLGLDVMCVPQAQIIHLEGATVKQVNEFSPRQFKMRMDGTLTYYKKRFGREGADEFYRLRSLRYSRLMKIAKLQGKFRPDMDAARQREYLDQVYRDFNKGDI